MNEQNWTRGPVKLAPFERDPNEKQLYDLILEMTSPRDSMCDELRAAAIICADRVSWYGFPNVSPWHIEIKVEEGEDASSTHFYVRYIALAMAENGRLFTAYMGENFSSEQQAEDFTSKILNDCEFVHETVAKAAALPFIEKHFASFGCPA